MLCAAPAVRPQTATLVKTGLVEALGLSQLYREALLSWMKIKHRELLRARRSLAGKGEHVFQRELMDGAGCRSEPRAGCSRYEAQVASQTEMRCKPSQL